MTDAPADLARRFAELAAAWEEHLEAERASSNPSRKIEHPAFAELVALGKPALPLVMERYEHGSLFWGAVAARIAGEAGLGDGLSGNVKDTRRRWLAWWRAQGEGAAPDAS